MSDPRYNGEKTPRQMPEGKRFQPGNPGRPKGSRNRLGEAFVQALHDDFQQHGIATIEKVRSERPHEYLKVVASLLPKQLEIKESDFDSFSDDELAAFVVAARSALARVEAGGSNAAATDGTEPPQDLQSVH